MPASWRCSGYDAVDQVAGVSYDAASPAGGTSGADRTVGYSYDAVGNRTAVSDTVNGSRSYSANADNEYTAVGGTTYTSDANGNLTGGNGTFRYDAQNRLISATVAVTREAIAYDSQNRVVERTVGGASTSYVYDGWNLIEEYNAGGTLQASYIHGVQADELISRTSGSTTVYYHQNANGNVACLTSATGTVVENYKYDAFGAATITDGSGHALTLSAYGNRFMFTGREYLAELGIYDYRNRDYSPSLGRFLQIDPIRNRILGWLARDPIGENGGINLYGYVGNNPLGMIDPWGLIPVSGSEFAEPGETQNSAYGPYDANGNGPVIPPNVPAASLPGPVPPGTKVTVTNPANGKSITVPVVDKGPWNTKDDYWNKGPCAKSTRPLAEQQYANKTKAQNGQVPSNPAGIDLTPATVNALGLPLSGPGGTSPVDWHFSK